MDASTDRWGQLEGRTPSYVDHCRGGATAMRRLSSTGAIGVRGLREAVAAARDSSAGEDDGGAALRPTMSRVQSIGNPPGDEQRRRLMFAQSRRSSIANGHTFTRASSTKEDGVRRDAHGRAVYGLRKSTPAFPSDSERAQLLKTTSRRATTGVQQSFRSETFSSRMKISSTQPQQLLRRPSLSTAPGEPRHQAEPGSSPRSEAPTLPGRTNSLSSLRGQLPGELEAGQPRGLPRKSAPGALARDFRARMLQRRASDKEKQHVRQQQEKAEEEEEDGAAEEAAEGNKEALEVELRSGEGFIDEDDSLPESAPAFAEEQAIMSGIKPVGFDCTAAGGGADCLMQCSVVSRGGRAHGDWKKENQDTFLMQVAAGDDWAAVGVYDGHGVNGRDVSCGVRKMMAKQLRQYGRSKPIGFDTKTVMKGLFRETERALKAGLPNVDKDNSGSCALLLLCTRDSLVTAWCGDSRAVLGFREEALVPGQHTWSAGPLSNDHKPEVPREHNRIVAANGRVERMVMDRAGTRGGPYRVFLRYAWTPGLAISRTFGDLLAQEVGVICEPDVKTHKLHPRDRFVVLGSDGVWDVLSNEEVVEMVGALLDKYGDADAIDCSGRVGARAAEELATEAQRRWHEQYAGNSCDDITVMVVMLNHGRQRP